MNSDVKWPKYFFLVLILSSFGPYIFKSLGIRLEHLIIYPSFCIAGLFFLFKMHKYRIQRDLFIFVAWWVIAFLWIAYISFGLGGQALSGGSLAVIDNFLLPMTVMILLVVFSRYYEISEYLVPVLKVLIFALGINSIIIILQVLVDPELFGVLDYFVRTRQETSVADRAAAMGRYLGIYNQPIEAGASYTLGLLSWVYLENIKANYRWWIKYCTLVLIFIGGMITVSKVFVIGGLGLFLGYVLLFSRPEITRKFLYTIPIVLGVVAYYLVNSMWEGFNYLMRLYTASGNEEGLLTTYFGSRFGSQETGIKKVFNEVFRESPIYGFGFSPPPILDNGFIEFFFHGGFGGLLIYVSLLFWLILKAIDIYFKRKNVFFVFLMALILGLNLGAPAFTLNRFSVIIIVLIGLLLLKNNFK